MNPIRSLLIIIVSIALVFIATAQTGTTPNGTAANPAKTTPNFGLQWDGNAASEGVTGYRLYEWFGGEARQIVPGEIVGTTADMNNVASGQHIYSVTAWNGLEESAHSNQLYVLVLGRPSPPGGLRANPVQLQALNKKLRVTPEHFVKFRQGVAPDYPHRILASREILGLAMTKQEATF